MAALCNTPCIFLSIGMVQSVNLITEEGETWNSQLQSAERWIVEAHLIEN